MNRDAWVLLAFALVAPFFGVAWFTYLEKFAEVLSGWRSPALLRAFQVAGVVVGLVISGASIWAARHATQEDQP